MSTGPSEQQQLRLDRSFAWKVLSTVLHKLRDRLPMPLAVHLGAQLPLLIRGVYYDQFEPAKLPLPCDYEEFMEEVDEWLADTKPVDPEDAATAVFALLSHHIPAGQIIKVQDALPKQLRAFWREAEYGDTGDIALPPLQPVPNQPAQEQEVPMQVQDLMTRDVAMINSDQTIRKAARLMAELDVGILPVAEGERLVGMITDRDIAIRGLAKGKGANTKVRDVMTPEVKYCFLDQDIDEIAMNMADIQVRRLPVLSRD